MCQWAGVDAEVEVFNFNISEEGNLVKRLHEKKVISSSKTRYTIHREGQDATRAVDKRSGD